jgi:hypothetical protein
LESGWSGIGDTQGNNMKYKTDDVFGVKVP